jgi:cytochrome c biogenesis protein
MLRSITIRNCCRHEVLSLMSVSDNKIPDAISRQTSYWGRIKSFFTSVRTTIWLLGLLAVFSIVGTVIPQELGPEPFGNAPNTFLQKISIILDLNNVYRSWWFLCLLILLSLNLLGCLIKRSRGILSEWRGLSGKNSFSFSIADPRSSESLSAILISAVSSEMGKASISVPEGDITRLSWIKHRFHLLGFPLLHAAIILILAGGLTGLLIGFKGMVRINEGSSSSRFAVIPTGQIRELPFEIAVEKFALLRYPSGEPREYRSDVRLVKDGKEAMKGSIKVNSPLSFEGISLYQSDYKLVGIKQVNLSLANSDGSTMDVALKPHDTFRLPDNSGAIRVASLDPGTPRREPSIEIAFESQEGKTHTYAVLRGAEAPVKIGNQGVGFLGFQPLYATGLQVGYDPGAYIVWIGSSMLVIGFFITLFANIRRLTIDLKSGSKATQILVSGRSKRQKKDFRQKMEHLVKHSLAE